MAGGGECEVVSKTLPKSSKVSTVISPIYIADMIAPLLQRTITFCVTEEDNLK